MEFRQIVASELLSAAKELVADRQDDMVAKYPPKIKQWSYNKSSNTFVIEASLFKHMGNKIVDPWGRPLDMKKMEIDIQAEDEIMGWNGFTTVEGTRFNLLIVND